MADLDLKLNITADGLQAQSELKNVNASLLDLGNIAQKSGVGIDDLGTVTNETTEKVGTLDQATGQTIGTFEKLTETVKNTAEKGFNLLVDHAIHGLVLLAAKTVAFGFQLKEAFSQEKAFADADRMFESTASESEKLNDQLKILSTTKIPVPLDEIAHLAKLAGSMGVAREEVAGFITTASEAALSFNRPAEELIQSLGGIKTAFQLTNEELPTFTDQVKAAADSATGMSTEAGIMDVLADGVAQAGREIKLTTGETVAFASAMLNTDGNVNNASSSLFGLFLSFKNVQGQSKQFKSALEQLGTSSTQFAADIKANPLQAITQLLEKLKGLSGESKIAVISGLVGQNQQQQGALLNLTNNLDLLKQQLHATADEEIYAGSVHAAFEKKLDTADSKLEFMHNAFKNLAAAIANPFLPMMKMAIDGITSFSNWLSKSAENSPFLEILAKSVSLFLGLGGSIRLASLFFVPVVTGLKLMLSGFVTIVPIIVTATETVFGYIASLKAMALAQIATVSSGAAMGFSFTGLISKIAGGARVLGLVFKELVGGAFGLIGIAITTLIVSLSYLSDKFSTIGSTSAKNSEIAWAALGVLFKNISEGIQPLIDWFKELGISIAHGFEVITGNSIKASSAIELFATSAKAQLNLTIGVFKFFGQTVGNIMAALVEAVSINVNAVEDIFSGEGIGKALEKRTALIDTNNKQFVDSMKESAKQSFSTDHIQNFSNQVETEIKTSRKTEAAKPQARPEDSGKDISTSDISALSSSGGNADQQRITAIKQEIDSTGKAIDAETARQTESLKAALEQRKADVALLGISEIQKEQLVTQAIKASNDAQLLIIKQNSDAKIAAIDKTLSATVDVDNQCTIEQTQFNKQSLQEKLEVYNAQAKSYGSMISSIISEEQKLAQESLKLTEQRKGIEQSYQDFKTNLLISSKTGWEKDVLERAELDKLVALQKKAVAEGDVKTAQDYDSRILEMGKKLAIAQQASINAGHGFQGQYDDIIRITDKAQAGLLAANQAAQNANNQRLGELSNSAAEAKNALNDVQQHIDNIRKQLQTDYKLQISPETSAVDAAIERIKQPTESTHTIHVVEDKGNTTNTSSTVSTSAYADGGLVVGKGTGTSDEVPALLEGKNPIALSNGEYVVKADKVKQFGVKAFDAINYGNKSPDQVKLGDNGVKKYASGGAVGDDALSKKVADLEKAAKDEAYKYFDNANVQLSWTQNGSNKPVLDPDESKNNFDLNADKYLKERQLPHEWLAEYHQRIELSKKSATGSLKDRAKAALAYEKLENPIAKKEVEQNTPIPLGETKTVVPPSANNANPQPIVDSPATLAPQKTIAPSVLPLPNAKPIIPANFTPPQLSPQSMTQSLQTSGQVHTIKLQTDTGKTAHVAGSSDAVDFFKELSTISGVTKL